MHSARAAFLCFSPRLCSSPNRSKSGGIRFISRGGSLKPDELVPSLPRLVLTNLGMRKTMDVLLRRAGGKRPYSRCLCCLNEAWDE